MLQTGAAPLTQQRLLSSAWGQEITPQVVLLYLCLGLWALPLQVALLTELLNHEGLLEHGLLLVIVTQLIGFTPQGKRPVSGHLQDV